MVRTADRVCVGASVVVVGRVVDGLETTVVLTTVVSLQLHVTSMMISSLGALGLLVRLTALESHIEGERSWLRRLGSGE